MPTVCNVCNLVVLGCLLFIGTDGLTSVLNSAPPGHGKLLSFDPSADTSASGIRQEVDQHLITTHLEERKSIFRNSNKLRRLNSETCSATTTTVKVGQSFSLGGKDSSYSNSQECSWLIEDLTNIPIGGTIGVAFTFFHTEEHDDEVKVYNADDNTLIGTGYSGDQLTPFIVAKSGVHRLKVVFKANEAVSESSRTLQLGFDGTVYNAGTKCFVNDCNGHGTCSTSNVKPKVCVCTPLNSDSDTSDIYLGDTCETKISYLAPNTPATLSNIATNEWSYHWAMVGSTTKYLIDFKDTGSPNSDPLLILGHADNIDSQGQWLPGSPVIPRLSSTSRYFEDYLSWYYDRSDIHYIHFRKNRLFNGNRAIIAVYNHIARSKAPVAGILTLRTSTTNSWPCVQDCSGATHGTCVYPGLCRCKVPWYGNGWRSPSTCEYEMKDITTHLDQKIGTSDDVNANIRQNPIRVGAWAYFKLTVDPNWVNQRTIAVDFTSLSPHAQPLVVVRKNNIPRLKYGYLPTYDAFEADFGDQKGFEQLQGQRQNIIINPKDVTLGSYFVIGIYDIWGHTALPQESHDSLNYTMYVNKYAAGIPCPKDSKNQFCSGYTCDFNKGLCDCPSYALGLDCSLQATALNATTGAFHHSNEGLAVKSSNYYFVEISKENAKSNLNLVVELIKNNPNEKSYPVLLARVNAIPFGTDRSLFDDHDFVSRYHESETHRILLSRDELEDHGKAVWYFSVLNQEDPNANEEKLTYKIRARLIDDVDCLSSSKTTICSGHGTCDRTRGRCTCQPTFTGDDCGDNGVFPIVFPPQSTVAQVTSSGKPAILVGEWVYYSLSIGCNTTIKVEFKTTSPGSRPLVVLEKDRLPLMVDSTHEYDDYYSGVKSFSHHQVIRIAPCQMDTNIGGQLRCYIHPLFPGTNWKTGAPAPGEWYIGIFNDANVGAGSTGVQPNPIKDYTLTITQETTCKNCAPGFRDPAKLCQTSCPGMHPEQNEIWSNTPMDKPQACDGHGICSVDGSKCECLSSYFGPSCSSTCPSDSKKSICSGHGTCGSDLSCKCIDGWGGLKCDTSCTSSCSGNGLCHISARGTPVCKCKPGWVGSQCNLKCSLVNGKPCNGQKCHSVISESAVESVACFCNSEYVGNDCSFKCPIGIGNKVCSDRGTCSLIDNKPTCNCIEGFEGVSCEFYEGCSNNCNGHGSCIGDSVNTKQCQCDNGYVGTSCALKCVVTSLSGLICGGHGTCSELNGKPICTCDDDRTGVDCTIKCPMVNGTSVCNNQGTCMVDEKDGLDGTTAKCACFDGFEGAACESKSLSKEEALKEAQKQVDSSSSIIVTVVILISLLIIGSGFLIHRKTKSRLTQYEVTFGTDALLANGSNVGDSFELDDGSNDNTGGKRGRGHSIKNRNKKESNSLAAEDVLAIGSMSIQMEEMVAVEAGKNNSNSTI